MGITKENNPELYEKLQDCDFDTDHIPKHGMGTVIVQSEHDGKKYICYAEWDYNNGIEWDYGRYEWNEVDEFVKECPCCGQIIP